MDVAGRLLNLHWRDDLTADLTTEHAKIVRQQQVPAVDALDQRLEAVQGVRAGKPFGQRHRSHLDAHRRRRSKKLPAALVVALQEAGTCRPLRSLLRGCRRNQT